jgi:hypothetical protein
VATPLAFFYQSKLDPILQPNGEYLQCPHPYSVFILGWCRAWTFIYFNKGIRSAFTTLLRVFTRLVPLTFLLLSFYLIHFFISKL